MNEVEQAKQFIKLVTQRLYISEVKDMAFESYWAKAQQYRLRYISSADFTGTIIKRSETFVTNRDNTNMLKILKLSYNLLQTNSCTDFRLNDSSLSLVGTQAGKGNFCIKIRLIDDYRHLQINVETMTNCSD